ncbi:MAG: hypothetical protein KQA34_01660 [Candidatus Aenigmarchaeota archaeon]|nr:hypothetical protein [Candidatus Aenigmarchaeota archaeon]
MKFREIPKELIKNVYKWKILIENKKDFVGSSPPSIFISSVNYPNVNLGVLSLPIIDERGYYLDFPELWYKDKLSFEKIIELRSRLIYSFKNVNIKKQFSLSEKIQELALAKNVVDLEVNLKNYPKFKFLFNKYFAPIGNPAKIENLKIQSNIKIENFVEKIVNDEIKASEATFLLYKKGLEISRIQKIFSAGLLGIEKRFVPTRWSITAIDSIISDKLIKKIRDYKILDKIQIFYNEYLGNKFWIILLPYVFGFEMIEFIGNKFYQDYEIFFERKKYAESVAGGYYAARLACCEYLEKIKRQAAVIVFRKIEEFYTIPLGVWKVRECIRDAFNKKPIELDSLEELLKYLSNANLNIELSKILRIYTKQKRVIYFNI